MIVDVTIMNIMNISKIMTVAVRANNVTRIINIIKVFDFRMALDINSKRIKKLMVPVAGDLRILLGSVLRIRSSLC